MEEAAEGTKKPGDDASPAKNLITALPADNAWFRNMVASSPMGISIARDGITIYANDACVKMFGYDSAEEFIGTSRLNTRKASRMPRKPSLSSTLDGRCRVVVI